MSLCLKACTLYAEGNLEKERGIAKELWQIMEVVCKEASS